MPDHILVERRSDGVGIVILNRPDKRNALSIALRDEVTAALGELAADSKTMAVVITGAGAIFSAGFDLKEFVTAAGDADLDRRLWDSSDRFHHALLEFPLPLIAAVNGPALAGGFDVAVCCDVRVAAASARFAHPEFTFGDIVYSPLHDLVGGAVARDLCLTGRELSAKEALELRLVSAVVDDGELMGAINAITERIVKAPRDKLMRSKAKAIARANITARATLDL
jgi:enoyl-CoA hydratase